MKTSYFIVVLAIEPFFLSVWIQGAILYAHYGRDEDFKLLQNRKISLSSRIMLIRAGGISFAEKVCVVFFFLPHIHMKSFFVSF